MDNNKTDWVVVMVVGLTVAAVVCIFGLAFAIMLADSGKV